jgi:hypothetical protein
VGDTAVKLGNREFRFAGLPFALLVFFALVLAAPSFAAEQEAAKADPPAKAEQAAKSEGVTFVNRSRDTQNVLAVFGGEKCEEMKGRAQLTIEPGQSAAVESGANQVCWCASTLGKVGNCTVWSKAKPGKQVTIR